MANSKQGIFASRRSVVHSTKGIVASTQPLANQAGIEILRRGGNAADAAVAVAAALNVTEPGMTGIGGDMFCLFYDASTRTVHALNGSGRSGSKLTLDLVRKELGLLDGQNGSMPMDCIHAITVPGAAAGWVDCVEHFGSGKVVLGDILAPAVELAEEGFPVSEFSATYWKAGEKMLKKASPNGAEMLKPDRSAPYGCRAPRVGEIMRLPQLAKTFRNLVEKGKRGFYEGYVADAIIKVVSDLGGVLCYDDLKHHCEIGSELGKPISLNFRGQGLTETYENGLEVWEHPPNGQGLVALMALGILQELEGMGKTPRFDRTQHNSAEYLHAVIEVLRIAFADGNWWIADPTSVPTTNDRIASLLSPAYLSERAKLFHPKRAISADQLSYGNPHSDNPVANTVSNASTVSPAQQSSDTVYFAITDSAGNAISFINSNFGGFSTPEDPAGNGFGSCIVPKGCGFVLQNRGAKFALHPSEHPNVLAPRKRPYHTIIPGMVTEPAERRWRDSNDRSEKREKVRSASRTERKRTSNTSNLNPIPTSKSSSSTSPADPRITPLTSNPTGPLHSTFGIMGGYMQPQGQVQLLLNQFIFHHDPQTALDAPRICVGAPMPDSGGKGSIDISDAKKHDGNNTDNSRTSLGSIDKKNKNNSKNISNNNTSTTNPTLNPNPSSSSSSTPVIYIEHGIPEQVVTQLKRMGHINVQLVGKNDWSARSVFGRGQIVRCSRLEGGDDDDDDDDDTLSSSSSSSAAAASNLDNNHDDTNENTTAPAAAAATILGPSNTQTQKRKRSPDPAEGPAEGLGLGPSSNAAPTSISNTQRNNIQKKKKKRNENTDYEIKSSNDSQLISSETRIGTQTMTRISTTGSRRGGREKKRKERLIYSAGSDPRGDGAAVPL